MLARLHAEVDALQGLDLTGAGQRTAAGGLLARAWSGCAAGCPSFEHALVQEVEARGLPQERGARTVAQYLRGLLRLDPAEAHARVGAAHAAARRRSLAGELLPAKYEPVAAAQADGSI